MSSQNYNVTKLSFSKRYFLLPIILIVFFLLFYLVYNDIKNKTINEFNNEQLILAQAASQGITSFFQNYQDELTFLSKNKLMIDFNDETKALMEGFYSNHKNFIEAVTRVDAQGKILYTYPFNKSVINQDISYQKHVHQILTTHQPVISDVFMAVQGYLAVALHVPVFKGQEFRGSLAILIQIDKLGKLYFEKIKDRGTGQTWLLSKNGIEIYCPIKGHKGKSILDITHNNSSTFLLMDKLRKENKGTTKSIHPERSVDGPTKFIEKYITFYRVPLGSTYWTILFSYNEEEIYAALTSFRNRLIVIFSFLFIVMAYYFYSFTKARTVLKEELKRKEAEKTLYENEEIFRRFMEHSPIYVFFKDENIRSLRLSSNYETMLGKPVNELLGKNMFDLFPTELAKSMVEDDKRILNEEKEITVEEEFNGRFYSTIKFPIIIDGKPKYLAGYTIDVTESKRSKEALEQANLIIENSPVVLFKWKAEKGWPVTFVSKNVVQFGYSPDELLNGSTLFSSIIHPEDLVRVSHEVDSKAKLGIDRFQQEYRILKKDRTICWVDDRTVAERNKEGQVTNYQGIVVDITERKQAEEALKQSELKYRQLFDDDLTGDYIVSADGTILLCNPALVNMLGLDSIDELMKLNVNQFYKDASERENFLNKVRENKKLGGYEHYLIRPDGKIISVIENVIGEFDDKGELVRLKGYMFDNTKRKIAEATLRESEKRYHDIFNYAPVGIYQSTPNDRFITVNRKLVEILGYDSSEELMKKEISKDIYCDQFERMKLIEKFEPDGSMFNHEIRWKRKNGEQIWISLTTHAIKDEKKKTIYFEGFVEDITERKLAEEALRESEKKFRTVIEEAVEIVFTVDDQGYFTYVNPAGIRSSGYSLAELTKLKYIDLIEPEYKRKVNISYYRQFKERRLLSTTEYPFRTKSGELKWFNQNARLVIENGEIKGFYVIARDVTERRKAEEALREFEAKLQVIIESTADGILAVDQNGKIIKTNNQFAELWRIPSTILDSGDDNELLSFVLDQLIDPEKFLSKVRQLYNSTEKDLDTLFFKDGRTFERFSAPLLIGDKIVGRVWSFRDITERRRAEMVIYDEQNLLASIINSLPGIVYLFNMEGIFLRWNKNFEIVSGYSHEEISDLHPSDFFVGIEKDLVQQRINDVFINGEANVEAHFVSKNGLGTPYFLTGARVEIKGEPHLIGMGLDITERKRAEEKLQEKENQMRMIVEGTPQLFFYTQDKQARVTYISPSIKKITGYSVEEWLNQSHWFITDNKINDYAKERTHAHLRGERTEGPILVEIEHSDKHTILLEVYESPIVQNENIVGLYGVAHDITERKRAEQRLKESEKKFRNLVESINEVFYISNNEGKITYCSPNITNATGFEPEQILGNSYLRLIAPLDRKMVIEHYKGINNSSATDTALEFRVRHKDGSIIWAGQISHIVRDKSGNVVEYRNVTRDITDRKLAEKSLRKSQEDLLKFFEDDLAADYISTPSGKLLNCNKTYLKVFGFNSKEEALAFPLDKIYPASSPRNAFLDLLKKNDKVENIEGQYIAPDGREIYTIENAIAEFDMAGEIKQIRGYIVDITERKKAEEELKKLSRAVEHSPVSVVITNKNGEIEYVNKKFFELTGYSKEDSIGKNPRILNSGYHDKNFYSELWNTILEGRNWEGEMRNKKKNGELYWELVLISPLLNSEGEITHFVAIKEDITEKKLMMEELIHAKELADQSNKLKDAFIANMSHEIRTPLNGILGFSSIIKGMYAEHINEEDEFIFTGIDHSSKRIIRTIDMILNYSRIQTGDFPISPSEIQLSSICENLVKEFSLSAKGKSLDLSFKNKCGKNTVIFADEYSITNSLSNLIDNSIKYSDKGSIEIILYQGDKNEIMLDVKDNGIGISKDYLSRIFEPYQQEHLGYGRAYEGVGLGLSMVKKFLDLNNVKISVKSEKGKGTTFTVNFGKSIEPSAKFTFEKKTNNIKTGQKTLKKPLVLLVEDDVFNQQAIKIFIEGRYETIVTDSSEGAIDVIKNNKVDLILMDISIKGSKNGLELTKELKASKEHSKIPVIAITAHAFESDRNNAIEAGCDEYLSKPFSKSLLLETIAKFV